MREGPSLWRFENHPGTAAEVEACPADRTFTLSSRRGRGPGLTVPVLTTHIGSVESLITLTMKTAQRPTLKVQILFRLLRLKWQLPVDTLWSGHFFLFFVTGNNWGDRPCDGRKPFACAQSREAS